MCQMRLANRKMIVAATGMIGAMLYATVLQSAQSRPETSTKPRAECCYTVATVNVLSNPQEQDSYVWRINVDDGRVSYCKSQGFDKAPVCSPWSSLPAGPPQ